MTKRVFLDQPNLETVNIEFTASPAELTNARSGWGYAYQRGLGSLGVSVFKPEGGDDYDRWGLRITGTTEGMRANLDNLLVDTEGIVDHIRTTRSGAPGYVADCLETAHRQLRRVTSDTPLMRAVGLYTEPFAGWVSSSDPHFLYAHTSRSFYEGQPASHEDGSPMGSFCSRQVGDIVIDSKGQIVPPVKKVRFMLLHETIDLLRDKADQNGNPVAVEINRAIDHFLKEYPTSTIEPVPYDDENAGKYSPLLSRLLVESLVHRTYTKRAFLGDAVRMAINGYIESPSGNT